MNWLNLIEIMAMGVLFLCLTYYLVNILAFRRLTPFLWFGIVNMAAAILFRFLPNPLIQTFSDVGLLIIFIIWLRTYTDTVIWDYIFAGFSLLSLLTGYILALFLEGTPLFLVAIVALVPTYIYFVLQYFQLSVYNSRNTGLIIEMRSVIALHLALILVLHLIMQYALKIDNILELAYVYLLCGYIFLKYNTAEIGRRKNQIASLEEEIQSVFSFMTQITESISENLDIDSILSFIVKVAVENAEADGGAIYMLDEQEKILTLKSSFGSYSPPFEIPARVKTRQPDYEAYIRTRKIRIGETVIGEAVQQAEAIFIKEAMHDERLRHNRTNDIQQVSSFIAIPLISQQKVLGVLSIMRKTDFEFFNEDHFRHIQTFADYASLSIENLYTYSELLEKHEIDREVDIAAEIQNNFIPQQVPNLSGISLTAYSDPLHGVSGDYYDYFPLNKRSIALFMCDVAGKGIPASMIMVMIHSIFHLVASPKRDTASTIHIINRGLCGRMEVDHYATLGYAVYDTENRTLEFSNAAHHPLLVIRPDGRIFQLDTHGLPVGIERNASYGKKTITLDKGDLVVMYTDGMTEAMNEDGQQYGMERLVRSILKVQSSDVETIESAVRKDLRTYIGNARQHDDITLMLMKIE